MVTVSASATAFELFGIQFFGGNEEDIDAVIADPRTYEITFETSADAALDAALRNASNLWTDRDEPASGVPGLLAKARGDYTRLLAALYNDGYYGGAISIIVAGREASSIPPDADLPDPVAITVTVNPGRQFVFGTLRTGNTAPADVPPDDTVPPLPSTGFATGQIARAGVIAQAETLLVQAWRHLGYPKAKIATREVTAEHPSGTLDVTLIVDPGAHAVIGPISTSGTENMDPDFIVRQTGLVPGQEYDPDDIALARARLARLDVFRSLRIQAAEAVGADGVLPYTIFVQEQKLRRLGIGATLSSVDGLGIEGYWLHRNLFGQAERLRLDAKVAGIGFPVETAEFDYAFGGTFTKPGIWTPDTDLVAAISAERTVLPLYEETSVGGRIGLEHLFTGEITGAGGFSAEYAYFEDDVHGAREFTTVGLYGAATYDSRDSTLDPTEGFYVSATVDPLYEFTYDNAIIGATIEGRTYFSFDPDDNYILAARVKAGAIVGPDVSEIPPSMLFFAGGGGSVRGYGYRSIGVETNAGITGGRYLLEGSLEARARFGESFGGVAFLDGGLVTDDTFPTFEDLRLGAGVGIRYYTALGPLRLDLAVPLNKTEDDPDYALYVGIGQAF
ncbi:autotransporter assembly complex protein TamA [Pelagibacterium halotolerans]